MFLISGKQSARKKIGYVADFCPTCQTIKPFEISRLTLGEHLYFVSFGAPKILGHVGSAKAAGSI